MPSLLQKSSPTDEQRAANDVHHWSVVLAVLGVMTLYFYLFTDVAEWTDIPEPEDLAQWMGLAPNHVFDDDGNVDSNITVRFTQIFRSNDDERFVLFSLIVAGFLGAYFLPLRYKQPALIACSLAGLLLLYGSRATLGMVAAHLAVYLVLHPRAVGHATICALLGLSANWALGVPQWEGMLLWTSWVAAPLLVIGLYRFAILNLLQVGRLAAILRTAVIQSAILTTLLTAVFEATRGDTWSLPLGILLFFWQWERLIMYHVDYKDGEVPKDLPLSRYLAVFFNPGVMPNWNWGVTIGQGYTYTNNAFLCEQKNRIVLAGVRIMMVALVYLVISGWLRWALVDLFEALGVPVHRAVTRDLVRHFVAGGEVTTLSVLATTFLDLVRWTMLWAGVVHFKVGVWRICGYQVDPYIQRPWAATNMSTLWSRFTFHYRAFLVRAFYYPVFFRFFRNRPYVRVMAATLAAAGFGNLVWGHVTERLFYRGMEWENVTYVLGTWPYFLLLGLGIGVSHVYLLWRRRRRAPWTLDRWLVTDVLAAYATLQYFALIHVFARPVSGGTSWDLLRLFAIGFGVEIQESAR